MELKQHIIDTMKEWQMKIGFSDENIILYYPVDSLYKYLNLNKENSYETVKKELQSYVKYEMNMMGDINLIWQKNRVGIEISAKGSKYVHEKIAEPIFLKKFLNVINDKSSDMTDVEKLFKEYAKVNNGECTICNSTHHNNGKVFSFTDNIPERYVYCVENDEFGITYHRFSKEDYQETFKNEQ